MSCIAKLNTKAWRPDAGCSKSWLRIVQFLAFVSLIVSASAQTPAPPSGEAASGPSRAPVLRVPAVHGRITAAELGLVINTADPYSVAVGDYYARRRGIAEENIVRLTLPVRASLTPAEFETFNAQLFAAMPPGVQGLALAWRQPFAVECNSITSALALGLQPGLCAHSCASSRPSLYFNHPGTRPFTELGLRPSMLLAARSVQSAQALIERGITADHSQPAEKPANAWFVSTPDNARNVRAVLFPPDGRFAQVNLETHRLNSENLPSLKQTMIYLTGLTRVPGIDAVDWLPGALADHLTSYGGVLDASPASAQMSAIDWLEAGATASYGTVSEPCNHLQKFPHPQLLLLYYAQGSSALEAYWRSVAWPGQGVFIGEPLAAPYAPKPGAREDKE